jgi:glutamine synthetase
MAGLLKYSPDYTFFLAPYVNSYKRFMPGTFAPTKRGLVGGQPHRRFPAVRRRHQGGAHRMPHRRQRHEPLSGVAAHAGRGNQGHRGQGWSLDAPVTGDVYGWTTCRPSPHTLRAATETLRNSPCCGRPWATGWSIIIRAARKWEQEAFDAVVTDWEIARGFRKGLRHKHP